MNGRARRRARDGGRRGGFRKAVRGLKETLRKAIRRHVGALHGPESIERFPAILEVVLFEVKVEGLSYVLKRRPAGPRLIFSRRQQQILEGIKEGKVNKTIAFELRISEDTVHSTVSRLLRKTGLSSRVQLAQLPILPA